MIDLDVYVCTVAAEVVLALLAISKDGVGRTWPLQYKINAITRLMELARTTRSTVVILPFADRQMETYRPKMFSTNNTIS